VSGGRESVETSGGICDTADWSWSTFDGGGLRHSQRVPTDPPGNRLQSVQRLGPQMGDLQRARRVLQPGKFPRGYTLIV
jgi:hypothetical protein